MRSRLLLIPVAIVASAPAHADTYLSVEQAQQLLFPGTPLSPVVIELSDQQFDAIREAAEVPVGPHIVRAWRTPAGGWFVLDHVSGRDDTVTYAVGIDARGVVTGIEILTCLPNYAGVRGPAWRHQFVGRKLGDVDDRQILAISGNSLSSWHIIEGVRRVLVTWDMLLRQRH